MSTDRGGKVGGRLWVLDLLGGLLLSDVIDEDVASPLLFVQYPEGETEGVPSYLRKLC
jgi:hypothetical protein